MAGLSYERQTTESRNPVKRFTHRSRIRRSVGIADSRLPKGGALLDFGAGPGKFLNDLRERRPDGTFYGYDKFQAPRFDGLTYVTATADIADGSIDVITAFEVLEHLIDRDIDAFLDESKRILTKRGTLIISVPIMYGPVTLIKEASNVVAHRRRVEYSPAELARVIAGKPIDRPKVTDRYTTHKGFDFRQLRQKIAASFDVGTEILSPFPALPWMLNSQIFLVAGRR